MLSVTADSTRPMISDSMISAVVFASTSYPYSIVLTASESILPKIPSCVAHLYTVGNVDGVDVGSADGALEGVTVGIEVGCEVGVDDGEADGIVVGGRVGLEVGGDVGVAEGVVVGVPVGFNVGIDVGI